MIMTRTPFRISFAGGGSDLPAFFGEEPGMVLAAAIDKYMYLTVKPRFGNTYRVSYSQTEIRDRAEDVSHPLVRECLRLLGVNQGLEIVSIADLPAQSGMGSSSSFTVGLLGALHALQGQASDAARLAREACQVEIDRLGEPIGKQDQYIAAYGGLQFIRFLPDGTVSVDPVICDARLKRELQRRLLLFHVGGARRAGDLLARQSARTQDNRGALRELCAIAVRMRDALASGRDLNEFGRLLDEAWRVKRSLDGAVSNGRIDDCHRRALEAGALGGKLLGAGGGGFLLFYCEPHLHDRVRAELRGLAEVPFGFDPHGAKVVYVGEDHF
jgi:D-glycero-alpha-D-manno-heptose-7-phosphate kinase